MPAMVAQEAVAPAATLVTDSATTETTTVVVVGMMATAVATAERLSSTITVTTARVLTPTRIEQQT